MKVLVVGRRGQLAESLVERAQRRNRLELDTISRPEADLAIPGSVGSAILSKRPDLVINAAAYTNVDLAEDEPVLAFRLNAAAAGEIAEAARWIGAPIIHLSTDYVFDGLADKAYQESDPVKPLGVYGRTKLEGEVRVRNGNPKHVIIRTAWVFSPFGRNFVKSVMGAAETRPELRVVNDQRGSPTSALDLAEGILTLVDHNAGWGEVYHLAGTGSASWFEFARAIMRECGVVGAASAAVVPINTEEWPTKAERPRNSVLDSDRFEKQFHFAMPNWRQSLQVVVRRLTAVA